MIVCGMVVGPGESARWLDRVLRNASHWADTIVIAGDGLDPDTRDAIVCGHDQGEIYFHTSAETHFTADESVVRNRLMQMLDDTACEDDLIVSLDADEELHAPGAPDIRHALAELVDDQAHDVWPVLFRHAWSPTLGLIRVDGGWQPSWSPRVWRHRHGARILSRKLACGSVPYHRDLGSMSTTSPLEVLHLGYARHDDRIAKYERYVELDGGRFHSATHIQSIIDPNPELVPCAF